MNTDPKPCFKRIRTRIQGSDDQKLKKKKTQLKIFDQKLKFTYVQATGEDFGPQKKTSSS